MLQVGEKAPLFQAESTKGTVRLQDYLGKQYVMLVFYPGDDTPICTKQLCAVQDSYTFYEALDTVVFGINPAEIRSHENFARKFHYEFPLLYDQEETIRQLYDVKKILGFFAQQRIVYIIDKTGTIFFAKKGNPSTQELLTVIKEHASKVSGKP